MSLYQHPSALKNALDDLEKDLLRDEGPQISTVRNYNFAILPYLPEDEFALRSAIQRLSEKLRDAGWNPETIALHSLLLERVRAQGPEFTEAVVAREKSLAKAVDPSRGLRMLKEKIVTLIEGPDGLAKDVIREIERIVESSAGQSPPARTVIFLGRAGALYLIDNAELSAPPPVFGQDRLGLLSLDAGRYELTCNGRVPTEVLAYVKETAASSARSTSSTRSRANASPSRSTRRSRPAAS